VVRAANNFVVSVTYFDDTPERGFNLRKEEARRVAVAYYATDAAYRLSLVTGFFHERRSQ
jgi:hypothetical protein